jgi:hypothetical protein
MLKAVRERLDARLRSNRPPTPDSPRPRAIRAAWVAALVAGGGVLCWMAFLVEQRLSAPATPPEWRDVTFDVVVTDAVTGKAVPRAQVGTDEETGQIDPPGPTWKGVTDAAGAFRLVEGFRANAVLGEDGKVRGRVLFDLGSGSPLLHFSSLFVVRAPGYREETINLAARFPEGIAYEDPSPRKIRVVLSPSPAR